MPTTITDLPESLQLQDEDYILVEQDISKKVSISDFKTKISELLEIESCKDKLEESKLKVDYITSQCEKCFDIIKDKKLSLSNTITECGIQTNNDDDEIIDNISKIQYADVFKEYIEQRTDISNLFSKLDIEEGPEFDTSNATSAEKLFYACYSLKKIPKYNTANIKRMNLMFYDCNELESIYLDTTSVTEMTDIFKYCRNLTTIRFNPNAGNIVDFDISYCSKMTSDDLVGMFESLPIPKETVTITLGSKLLNKLNEEQKQIAIDKSYALK